MNTSLAAFALSLLAATSAFAAEIPIKPFHAEYATLRNGSELGRTTLDLRDNGDGSWTLRSETNGTQGLARIAGVHVVETSRFRWQDDQPQGLAYEYQQEGAFRQRVRRTTFDWQAGEVQVREGDKDYRYRTTPRLIDRQIVTIAIANDLARGASTFEYPVAVKESVETMRYARGPLETVEVPAGTYTAQRMQRFGFDPGQEKRASRSWLAESLGWLPVMIEQTEKNGDTVVLKLVSVARG